MKSIKNKSIVDRLTLKFLESKKDIDDDPSRSYEWDKHHIEVFIDDHRIGIGVQNMLIVDSEDHVFAPTVYISLIKFDCDEVPGLIVDTAYRKDSETVWRTDTDWSVDWKDKYSFGFVISENIHTNNVKRKIAEYLSFSQSSEDIGAEVQGEL